MKNVRDQVVFCPKFIDVKLSPCTDPPSIVIVQEELIRVIEGGLNNINDQVE
jgi:hypothetical protein